MADLIFLDAHTRPRPSKGQIDSWSQRARGTWWSALCSQAVEQMGGLLGAQDHHLTLTAGRQEAHFHVLYEHYVHFIRKTGRTHIVTLESEQPSILKALKRLQRFEVQGKLLPLEQLTPNALSDAIRARTGLLSLSWAHPHTGVIQPVSELIALCKEHEVKVHLDVSAAVGKRLFQLADLDVDFLTLDGALLHLPVELGAIFSKEKLEGMRPFPYPYYAALSDGLAEAFDQVDCYALEVAYLRDHLEEKLEEGGVTLLYRDLERLPNVAVALLSGIHGEKGVELLKKRGIFAAALPHRPSAVSFALPSQTTVEEIDRVAEVFLEELATVESRPFVPFSEEEARAKNMRVAGGSCQLGTLSVTMSLLVDEEDGVIADCRLAPFGPSALDAIAVAVEGLLLRKNYMQARRLTAELIEKELKGSAKPAHLNLFVDVIDEATSSCFDIPIEEIYEAPPEMASGERTVYPGWEELSDVQKKQVVSEVIDREVVPYVALDAGGVEVKKVEDNRITIVYSGNCTSCYSATGATLDAIGNILRHKIYPDLMVLPDMEQHAQEGGL